ncbi:DUF1659 domain-containing protein [Caldanaerobius polysaccharolyticus]|uniref:DUF1659 domain-containing protein n=1 Tax=Caldanaerobius polysaccharolyticus TaxID=44256 RepID=UPI000478A689|nr:DUF1659 domain-containing protein [Caldanaerobius polysaccharolyticus]
MAVLFNLNASRLTIEYDGGIDAQGRKITVRSNYNIKADATDQDAMDAALIIAGLQKYQVNQILRQNTGILTQQP